MRSSIALPAAVLLLLAGPLDAQWSITMRALQNPLPLAQCTAIEVVALGPDGRAPLRPDGKQVSGWDFDLEFAAAAPDAFAWNDERHRFLCARAPTAPSALVVASYPARHLKPSEIVPDVILQQTVEVSLAGVAPSPGPAQVSVAPSGAQPGGYPYEQPGYPSNGPAAPPQTPPQAQQYSQPYPQPYAPGCRRSRLSPRLLPTAGFGTANSSSSGSPGSPSARRVKSRPAPRLRWPMRPAR